MNVFKNPWKFTRAPIRWFKYFFRSFKYAYQRATRGYCDYDVYDCDTYYTHIISGTLHQLADRHMGYPGEMTPESWTAALNEIAEHFDKSLEENEAFPQPKTDEWYAHLEITPTAETFEEWRQKEKELSAAMIEESKVLEKLRSAEKDIGLDMLKEYWYHLWD